ncbi:MAG: hypothetical protein OXC81_02300, partial [Betaproteobacteria bacterium]|nr:hypothetical protein [Betaproteobacteria bacterium]
GAWVRVDSGEDGKQDPLALLPDHFSDGLKAATATGRIHFYYGLNGSLSGRDTESSGCEHIRDYCIGAPYRFNVQLRNNKTIALAGKASTFAFAAYLGAWQRLPARSRISAVFDLARNCVDDIGAIGADDDTGIGRLDIGCLAYRVTREIECPDGQELTAQGVCEPLVCEADEFPIGNACVVKKICPAGQELNETDNTCQPCPAGSTASGNTCTYVSYWTELQSASYATDSESALEKAFRVASASTVKINRSSHAHLLFSGSSSQGDEIVDFLAGAGIAGSQYTYKDMSGMDNDKIGDAYRDLSNSDFVYFSFLDKLAPFLLPGQGSSGLQLPSLINGAWTITDNSLSIAEQYVVIFSDKMHLYYGLTGADLTVRHSSSGNCRTSLTNFSFVPPDAIARAGIKDNCIGAPYSLMVRLRDDSTKTLTGIPAAFAFAAYLSAWERMPGKTHSSAVFDMAVECIEDIGQPGPDIDTGLGRLDIGCLAYEAAQAIECEDEAYILPATTCGWDYFFNHASTSITLQTSPHRRAFKDAGIESRLVDRSADAYVMDTASHGKAIRDLLTSIDLGASYDRAATVNYTYLELIRHSSGNVLSGDKAYELLSSNDFASLSWLYTFGPQFLANGAWVLRAAGNGGFPDWANNKTVEGVATGKIHFIWGTDDSYEARNSNSNTCHYVEHACIGAPFSYYIDKVLTHGTSFATPFAFAAYLLAWERMPERTHISTVFDLALGCVDDLGEPGPDADTGLGRLDIGCMAHRAKKAPSCEQGHVLVSFWQPVCERYSYWLDMQAPLGLILGQENLIERAYRENDVPDRVTDRSARAHLAVEDEFVDHLRLMGITATVNYSHISSASNVVTEYANLSSSDLFAVAHQTAGELFTSDKTTVAGIESGDITGGAWIVAPIDYEPAIRLSVFTKIFLTVTVRVEDEGSTDSLAGLASERQQGIRQAAATGKVHFLYGLNDDLDGRNDISDGCTSIENYCIGVPSKYRFRPLPTVSATATVINDIVEGRGNRAGARLGFSFYLTAW